jgi:UDP-glucose 4-epimerase
MRLLVTGGAGYIGSVVTRMLLAEGHDVVVLDDLSTGHADAVPDRAELVSDGFSVREVIATAERVTGHRVPTRLAPRRPGDPARLIASSARIGRELGWHPEHDLTRIVADAWSFHRGPQESG